VATGALDMPLKLPAPDLGTAAQPEPKLVVVAEPADEPDGIDELDGMADDDALADDPDDAVVPLDPLLHAAVPTARPAMVTVAARIRRFMIFSSL
jgi:hypothetical protein